MTNPALLSQVASDVLTSGGVNGTVSVTSTAIEAKVAATKHAQRKLLIVNNTTTHSIFWGFNSSVTSSTGIEIAPGAITQWAVTENVAIYLITDQTAMAVVRVAEGA